MWEEEIGVGKLKGNEDNEKEGKKTKCEFFICLLNSITQTYAIYYILLHEFSKSHFSGKPPARRDCCTWANKLPPG